MKKRINNINQFIENPIKTQQTVIEYLIKKGEKTEFGEEHKFQNITNYNDFCQLVPIRTYEEISPYIEKVRNGSANVLWPGKIKWFAKSSGTTNSKSKFIPISKESLHDCHFKGGKDMLSLYENNFPKINIYNGKGLMLGGAIKSSENGFSKEGDLSAILLNEFPFWVNLHRVPDIETALMGEWEEKLERIAKQAVNENITNITGVPSWMLILLKRILAISGKENILEVWPKLELYMHGGVNFEPYRSEFEKLIPTKKMNYLEGYNASEGFLGIQDQHPSKGILLMLDYGIYYEFIPMTDFNKGELKAINLSQVELVVNYALVITTNTGLWRYLIGDVISFTTINPFRIKIAGRTKSCINTFGEELMVHNTDEAILFACKLNDCSVKDYTVAPLYISNNSGGHQWYIEFEQSPKNTEKFMQDLDKNLQNLNSDYQSKRTKNLILKFPELVEIKNNEFYKWLSDNNKLGGQFKVPRLSENREIADYLLELQ